MCSSILSQRHRLRSPCLGGSLANRPAIWNFAPASPRHSHLKCPVTPENGAVADLNLSRHAPFHPDLPAANANCGKDRLTPPIKSGPMAATDKRVTHNAIVVGLYAHKLPSPYANKREVASNGGKQPSKGITANWRDSMPEGCSISSAIRTNGRRIFGLRRGKAMLIGTFSLV